MRSALAVALALGALPATLATQPAAADIPAGTRVRVSAPSHGVRRAIGTLTRAGPDTIAFTPVRGGGGPIAFSRSSVTRFELSRGRRSPVLAGATWAALGAPAGALAGGAIGFIQAFTDENPCDADGTRQECERVSDRALGRKMSSGAAVGAVVGVVAGAVYGVRRRGERWQLAGPPLRLGSGPVGLTVSIAFGRP